MSDGKMFVSFESEGMVFRNEAGDVITDVSDEVKEAVETAVRTSIIELAATIAAHKARYPEDYVEAHVSGAVVEEKLYPGDPDELLPVLRIPDEAGSG